MQKLEEQTALFIPFWSDASILAMDTVPWRITEGHIHPNKNRRDV
jgi:hypothetical protein